MSNISVQLQAKRTAQLTQPKAKPTAKISTTSFDLTIGKPTVPKQNPFSDELSNLMRRVSDARTVFSSAAEQLPRSKEMALEKINGIESGSKLTVSNPTSIR